MQQILLRKGREKLKNKMKSPITGSNNVILEKEILSSFIIERYKKELCIDVSKFFKTIDKVSVYKCIDTGYRFYHPFNLSGDDVFYQELEKFPWYYMDWKWEHSIAESIIKKNDKVLEIGCASGSFLKKIKVGGAIVEGLEMNSAALKRGLSDGLTIHSQFIEDFSKGKDSAYDIVCSFEVMEHVTNIKSFINSSLSILRPGGKMIVSIPNNECLMFEGENIILNMPPHHMGMWDINSLIKLQNYFEMKIESIHQEPLQKYHIGFANKVTEKSVETKLRQKLGPFTFLLKNIANRFAFLGVSSVSNYIIGHTILVVFKKNE